MVQAGAPVSGAYHVGLALVHSATAMENHQAEAYGKYRVAKTHSSGRWNGRVILILGDRWTEVEEPIAQLRPEWFGQWKVNMTTFQQKLNDMR